MSGAGVNLEFHGKAYTESIVMRSKSGTTRYVKSEHSLDKLKTYASVQF